MTEPSADIVDTMALPDHAVRRTRAFQLYCRLWRPTLGWMVVLSAAYIFAIGPAIARPVDPLVVAHWLVLALALFGIRSWEKAKGVG